MPRPVPDLPPFGRGSVGAFIPRSGANYAGFKHIPFVQRHRFRIFLGCVALGTSPLHNNKTTHLRHMPVDYIGVLLILAY